MLYCLEPIKATNVFYIRPTIVEASDCFHLFPHSTHVTPTCLVAGQSQLPYLEVHPTKS